MERQAYLIPKPLSLPIGRAVRGSVCKANAPLLPCFGKPRAMGEEAAAPEAQVSCTFQDQEGQSMGAGQARSSAGQRRLRAATGEAESRRAFQPRFPARSRYG